MHPAADLSRRRFLQGSILAGAAWLLPGQARPAAASAYSAATFTADITPPLGHPLIGGLRGPAVKIVDRLMARGVVITGSDKPLVIAALDWCELRNDAYDQFRDALAQAAGTTRERVLLSCNHQ